MGPEERGSTVPTHERDEEQPEGIKLSAPLLCLVFVWWYYFLEREHQRILLFLVAFFKFAEYFYHLPSNLEQYQSEDWWDIPTIKQALTTMAILWLLAFISSKLPSWWTGSSSNGHDNFSSEKRRRWRRSSGSSAQQLSQEDS